jgi:formylglycine-generating enzyme required for sulfatase activity
MKTKSVFSVSLLFLVVLLCGSSKKWDVPSIVNFNQRFVPVDKNLYADKYEVSVKDYQLFLREKRETGADCALLMYDSTVWRKLLGDWELFVEHYFTHPAWRDYPINCISHYAANEFCKWLTEKYEANSKKKYKKVIFRLPTELEYKKAAISIYDSTEVFYPWGHNQLFDCKKGMLCNCGEGYWVSLIHSKRTYPNDWGVSPSPIQSYDPNPYGLYNMVGNVAEMIQEEGIAMGGNYLSESHNVKITSKKKYETPSTTVGFRVYMEIIAF